MNAKELAELCQVHYNTMRKWLNDNQVEKAHKGKNATYLINDEVIEKAKQHFNFNDVEQVDNNCYTNSYTSVEQLAEKDKQINHLHKLLEQQQILTLKATEKVELLENNQQHQDQPTPPQEHKSIFKKLFKK